MQCPWLVNCLPSLSRKERRNARVRAPRPLPGYVIYRSDGASRGQGRGGAGEGGWGSAVWESTTGLGIGPPAATSREYLGQDVSNNVAEYSGLRACMVRALRILDARVVFEVDSMLLRDKWPITTVGLAGLQAYCRYISIVCPSDLLCLVPGWTGGCGTSTVNTTSAQMPCPT